MGMDATKARVAAWRLPLTAPRMAALVVALATLAPAGEAPRAQETPANPPPVVAAPAPLPGPTAAPDLGTVAAKPGAAVSATPPAQAIVPAETSPAPMQAPTQTQAGAPEAAANTPALPSSAAPIPTPAPVADHAPTTSLAPIHPRSDLSPWGMFLAADTVVKGVMIGLALASLVTWTVCLAKSLELFAAKARLRRGLRAVLGARSLGDLADSPGARRDPASVMAAAARHEVEASAAAIDAASAGGLLDRVASTLSRIEARMGRRLTLGTGLLATIGATAPFVGLFGTVWGIMNSFVSISETQTTNLAVVAPGIAEALLATALGLVAAIPAVVIYNHFARSITAYRALLADTAAGVERLVSRDLDLERLPAPALRRAAE